MSNAPIEFLVAHEKPANRYMTTDKLSPQNLELLSALTDGELTREELPNLFEIFGDPAAAGIWNTYHVVGEVLRSPGSAVQLTDLAFLDRLTQQLLKEPSFGTGSRMPAPVSGAGSRPIAVLAVDGPRGPASNDGNFRWKVVAGFACVTAVSTIAWGVSSMILPITGSQFAQVGTLAGGAGSQQVVVASPQGLMVRDTRLEELLAAHKQLGATSALPVPSGFLRNATFETQQGLGR